MPQNEPIPTASKDFNESLHLLRGMAILLVVIGHAITPAYEQARPAWLHAVHGAIFTFHMHAFFFISGYLGWKFFFAERRQAISIALRQLKRLGLVYLFYSALGVLLKLFVPAGLVYRPVDFRSLLADVFLYPQLNPMLALWFLYVLLAIEMLFLLTSAVLRLDYRKPVVVAIVLVLLLAANQRCYGTPKDTLFGWTLIGRYAVYFFLGFVVGQHGRPVEQWLLRHRRVILIAGAAYFGWLLVYGLGLRRFAGPQMTLLYALAGITSWWALAIHLSLRASPMQSFFHLLADYSYEIYTNSGMFQAASRMAILKGLPRLVPAFTPLARPTLLVVGILIGLALPILLTRYLYTRNVWLRRLAMGEWKRGDASAAWVSG